jgi:glycolate oxidase iron-sulfur subunit
MGREDDAFASARKNVAAWWRERQGDGLDAIVINTSGCGTTVKDYGYMLRNDADWADKAALASELAVDVSELMARLDLRPVEPGVPPLKVAYHAACSLQHGQRVRTAPKDLLRAAGFDVVDVPEAHLCCGSAGTYNLLQPDIADRLQRRKVKNIESTAPQVVAAGNIGCMVQIGGGTELPVVHTVALLDWATGGPKPAQLD